MLSKDRAIRILLGTLKDREDLKADENGFDSSIREMGGRREKRGVKIASNCSVN
jgi:hypothetical protein